MKQRTRAQPQDGQRSGGQSGPSTLHGVIGAATSFPYIPSAGTMGVVSDEIRTRALAAAVTELERHAAAGGWDGPVGVYALVRTRSALESNPSVATELGPEVVAAAELGRASGRERV